jgi:hypothetical protein
MSLEGAAAIRASSAAELRFRLEAGKRLTAEKRMIEQKRTKSFATDQESVQILVKPGNIRLTKGTTTKTLRALAIHVIEEGPGSRGSQSSSRARDYATNEGGVHRREGDYPSTHAERRKVSASTGVGSAESRRRPE